TYALHIFLVALHIALFIVFRLHLEQHIMIHLSDHWIGKTSTAMTIAATFFATVYATTLVWLTQRLAFRRLLSHGKSLTAIHDEYNSWIGLGSAFITLWGQRSRRSALRWVMFTTIYLGGIDILHVSIPAMFTLQVGTAHRNSTVVGELAYSDVRDLLYTRDAIQNTDAQNVLGDASSLLPYIALLGSELSVGLDGATIYDRLPVNIGAFNTTVNSTTFNVECGLLYSPKVNANPSDPGGDEVAYYDVSHGLPNAINQDHVRLMYLSHNNTAVLTHQHVYDGEQSAGNRSFYLYGTFDIEDSSGNIVPTLELLQGAGPASDVSMVGCDLFARNDTIMVNTTSRLPLPGEIPDLRDASSWSMWEPQPLPDPQALDMLDLWSTTFKMQYSTSLSLAGTADSSPSKDIYLGFMESFVISTLGLDISGSQGTATRQSRPRGRVQLFHVENALSRLAAAYYWSLSRIESDGNKNKNIVPIAIPIPVRQLQLNGYPIAVGLAASVLLLTMSHLLVRQRSRAIGGNRMDIPKSLGLLQFLWFVLNIHPVDGDYIKKAKSTEESHLRGWGLPYGRKGSCQKWWLGGESASTA
ncbi:hypothetical protein EV714DRAFT_203825, partial [Schizophyllum commune]